MPNPFIIKGNHAVFMSLTVILCEMQVSLSSSGPGVTSTNHATARCRSTNYTPAVRTGGGMGCGGVEKRVQMTERHRDSEQSSFDRNGMLPVFY